MKSSFYFVLVAAGVKLAEVPLGPAAGAVTGAETTLGPGTAVAGAFVSGLRACTTYLRNKIQR